MARNLGNYPVDTVFRSSKDLGDSGVGLGSVVLPDCRIKAHPLLERRTVLVVADQEILPGDMVRIDEKFSATFVSHDWPSWVHLANHEYGRIGISLAGIKCEKGYRFWVQTAGLYEKDGKRIVL